MPIIGRANHPRPINSFLLSRPSSIACLSLLATICDDDNAMHVAALPNPSPAVAADGLSVDTDIRFIHLALGLRSTKKEIQPLHFTAKEGPCRLVRIPLLASHRSLEHKLGEDM